MLVTMPDYDLVTQYASAWSKDLLEIAERNGIIPIPLKGKSVTRSAVVSAIESKNPRFLVFNGHGSESMIAGHKNEPIIVFNDNHHLLQDKIVHAFTCDSGRLLGKECGAKAFIGYSDLFFLCMYGHSISRPLEDKLATPIMECAMEAPEQIAKKKTAREAYDKSQEKYEKAINEYTHSNSKYTTEELQVVLPCLFWNKTCQVLHGSDANAKLE